MTTTYRWSYAEHFHIDCWLKVYGAVFIRELVKELTDEQLRELGFEVERKDKTIESIEEIRDKIGKVMDSYDTRRRY